jgi:hypothetical protein
MLANPFKHSSDPQPRGRTTQGGSYCSPCLFSLGLCYEQ